MTKLIASVHNGCSIARTAACLAVALLWLSPLAAAAEETFPASLTGIWVKQADAPMGGLPRLALAAGAITFDSERCRLDRIRTVHARRWYADVTCPDAPVWLDVNLLSANRMMLNRRPLDEADIYVRVPERSEDDNR
jgi:hypothetical protein